MRRRRSRARDRGCSSPASRVRASISSWADAGGRVGVKAGDRICRVRATVAGLASPESFKAFLSSTSTGAAIDCFENDGPRFRVDGVRFGRHRRVRRLRTDDALRVDRIDRPGRDLRTRLPGLDHGLSTAHGNLGMANASDGSWSGFSDIACNFMQHALYCVSDLPRTDVIELFGGGFDAPALRRRKRAGERSPARSSRRTNENASDCSLAFSSYGAPGEIRTPDPQVRSLVLYPTELRARSRKL
jgi:hypothetical protein